MPVMRYPVPTVNIHAVSTRNHTINQQSPEHVIPLIRATWGQNILPSALNTSPLPVDAPDSIRYMDIGSLEEEMTRLRQVYKPEIVNLFYPTEQNLKDAIDTSVRKDRDRAVAAAKSRKRVNKYRENPEFLALGIPIEAIDNLAKHDIFKLAQLPSDLDELCEKSGLTPNDAIDVLEIITETKASTTKKPTRKAVTETPGEMAASEYPFPKA